MAETQKNMEVKRAGPINDPGHSSGTPNSLSDIEFSKLKFPKQPFMNRLGEDILADYPKEKPSNPPVIQQVTAAKLVMETDRYKIIKFSSIELSDANKSKLEVVNEIEIKDSKVTVKVSGKNATDPEEIAKTTSETLALVKKEIGTTPSEATYLSNAGYLEFTHEGKKYLASPRFLLEESGETKLRSLVEEEVTKTGLKLKELQSGLGEVKTWKEMKEKDEILDKQIKELGEKVNGGLSFHYNFEEHDYSSYSKEIQNEFKNLIATSKELKKTKETLIQIGDLTEKNTDLQDKSSNMIEYKVVPTKTDQKVASFDGSRLEIYDNEGNKINEEVMRGWRLESTKYLAGGTREVLSIPIQDPIQHPKALLTKTFYSADEQTLKIEVYSRDDKLISIEDLRLGFFEKFQTNAPSEITIIKADNIFEHAEEISKRPNGERIIFDAVKNAGINNLRDYGTIIKIFPQNQTIIETGLSKLNFNELKRFEAEVAEFQSGENQSKDEEPQLDLSPQEAKKLKDLLEFRSKMVQDGTELSRDTSYERGEFNPGPHLWNDPKSRGYFEIKDSWINWESEQIRTLLNESNTELSKKELKLLSARMIFDNREEINETTVNNALTTIKELREKYNSVEVFEGRNIVFVANNERLPAYEQSENDNYSFGRRKLLDAIKVRQGEGKSFTLVQDKEKITQNIEKISEVLGKEISDIRHVEKIVKELQDTTKNSEGEFTKKNIENILNTHSIDLNATRSILNALRLSQDETFENSFQTKQKVLDSIRNTPPPFTFIFEGHGSPDAIYLSDGQLESGLSPKDIASTIKISPEELANAIIERQGKFPENTREEDVYVFQNCLNSNFIRTVDENLHSINKPVFIGASEFNQLSYYSHDNKYGSQFIAAVVLGIKKDGEDHAPTSKIEDVIKRQFLDLKWMEIPEEEGEEPAVNTNSGIYVPDENGKLRQISSLDTKNNLDYV